MARERKKDHQRFEGEKNNEEKREQKKTPTNKIRRRGLQDNKGINQIPQT